MNTIVIYKCRFVLGNPYKNMNAKMRGQNYIVPTHGQFWAVKRIERVRARHELARIVMGTIFLV